MVSVSLAWAVGAVARFAVVPLSTLAMVSPAVIPVPEIWAPTSARVKVPDVMVTLGLLAFRLPVTVRPVVFACHFRRNKWPVLSTKATWEPSRESVTEVGIVSEVL
jgi:hypothetical protein